MKTYYKQLIFGTIFFVLGLIFNGFISTLSFLISIFLVVLFFIGKIKDERQDNQKDQVKSNISKLNGELNRLQNLMNNNLITQDDFDRKKAELQAKYAYDIQSYTKDQ